MAIGKRIKFFRTLKGLTQKQFGEALGFKGKTSDVRLAQYEAEARIPKEDLVKDMARILEVNPQALTVPEIDTYNGLLHTLFALEDMYGFKISEIDGQLCICLDRHTHPSYLTLHDMLHTWQREVAKLESGEITKEEYDEWRYNYPTLEAKRTTERLNKKRKENK